MIMMIKLYINSHMQEIINEADMDRNGLIDYTEFFTMMTPKRS